MDSRDARSSPQIGGLMYNYLVLQPVSFAAIVPTAYGQMLVNRYDINQTNALFKTGLAIEHGEIKTLATLLGKGPPDPVVIDVGANFGTYTLAFSAFAGPRGRVYSYEAQRMIYYMLAGSVALNSLTNVHCFNAAVGDHEGSIDLPQFDYSKPMNFGSVEFGPTQKEQLPQERTYDPAVAEKVPLTTLDKLDLPRVDLIKIDVEGMEAQVLAGASATIRRCQPLLFVEFLKGDPPALLAQMVELGYEVFQVGFNYLGISAATALAQGVKAQLQATA